jgi:hypothetical protein
MCDWSYDLSVLIWNRISEVLNMTIDLAATDNALPTTHDLSDMSRDPLQPVAGPV